MIKNEYTAIGLMSGTSLDGLDVVLCRFRLEAGSWQYRILDACTLPYDERLKETLGRAGQASGYELLKLHKHFGRYIAQACRACMDKHAGTVDFIASHGHTVYHRPDEGVNFQLGDGNTIAALCGVPVVYDFRSLDIALGGQGAPLVPAGDELLFGSYAACVNLGGFANISYKVGDERVAFDICPCNIALNLLAGREGLPFDRDGALAAAAGPDEKLLHALNRLPYYEAGPPKSLGREWLDDVFLPVMQGVECTTAVLLRTVCEHIAMQVGKTLGGAEEGKAGGVLITGGGALNRLLMDRITKVYGKEIPTAEPELISYKEALIFAFLGMLRMRKEFNCLKSVTGAAVSGSSGNIVYHAAT